MSNPIPTQIFSGLRVLAVTRITAAPFCAMQLALNGADVITIENPSEGDSQRYSDHIPQWLDRGMGRGFLTSNLNKRSLTLAINTPEGQAIFKRLAKQTDVIIENLRTGGMSKYGLGFEELKTINPGLIFCSITGYGQTGPKASDPGIDDAIQAASGMMSCTGTSETGPLKTGTTVVDITSGYVAAFAISGALYHRNRTGVGQAIDISMMEVAMSLIGSEITRAATSGEEPPLVGNASNRGRYLSNSFRCGEGTIMIAARADNLRERFYKAIDRMDLPKDDRFSTPSLCRQNIKQLEAEVEKTLLTRTAEEWEEYLNEKGVAAMRVLPLKDAIEQPQIKARQFLHTFSASDDLPEFTVPTAAYRFSETQPRVEKRPPKLGEHTDAVLTELGFSKDDIADLRARNII